MISWLELPRRTSVELVELRVSLIFYQRQERVAREARRRAAEFLGRRRVLLFLRDACYRINVYAIRLWIYITESPFLQVISPVEARAMMLSQDDVIPKPATLDYIISRVLIQ